MEHFLQDSNHLPMDSQCLVKAITNILKEIVNENNEYSSLSPDISSESHIKSVFDAKKIPSISLSAYIDRILKYSKAEEATLISALIYIDLLCEDSKFTLSNLNIHRVVLTAIVLAVKYNEDEYFSNSFYAKVGGILNEELNSLEYEFLVICNFSIAIKQEKFSKYYSYLRSLINSSN